MNMTKKRWVVLIASCIINLCIGSVYAWSVFSTPLAEHLTMTTGTAITSGDLAIIFTVTNAIAPVMMIAGGFINDKLGPKWVIFTGGILFGAGLIISGFAATFSTVMLGYAIIGGIGLSMVYGCTISNSVKFFPDKRGLIGGIATATYGLSSVIVPPIANSLIESFGITTTFKIIGAVFLVIITVCSFFVKKCPDNFTPEGWTPPTISSAASAGNDKNWKGMLSDPIFYIMLLMLCLGAFFGMMTISQASPIAQNMIGMSAASASIAVSILALFNAAGRVCAGYISDKIGRINTLASVFVVAIIGLLLLFISGEGSIATFYIGVSIVGICFGAFMGIYPGFTADQFGAKNNSVNYGIMFIGFALAGLLGPMVMSSIYKSSGSYKTAFIIAMILSAAGFAVTFIYRAVAKAKSKKA